MDADVPLHWNRRQLASGVVIFRAGPRARQFFEEWKSAMRDPRALTDAPNVCGLPNFDGFIEHRHDQSILTILAVKHQIEVIPPLKAVHAAGDPRSNSRSYFEGLPRQPNPRAIWRRRLGDYLGNTLRKISRYSLIRRFA